MRICLSPSDKYSPVEEVLNSLVIQKCMEGFISREISHVLFFLKHPNNLQTQSLLYSPVPVGKFMSRMHTLMAERLMCLLGPEFIII